jgi:flavin-dependent dehydrogenase
LWVVDDRIAAPVLVGAGGHFCPVARHLNPGRDEGPVVVAREVEFRMSAEQARRCPVRGELPELFFCTDRRGYGWCVRKEDYLNVGFGRLGGADFNEQARRAVEQFVTSGRVPDDVPDRWVGHAYRVYARPQRTCVSDGVLLAGDAAGLAHPVSGEGILRAVESGRLAARAVLEARGDYRAGTLASYPRALATRYGRPNGVASEEPTITSALASRVGVWLMSTRWFTRRVLLDRWFLHVNATPLAI